MDVELKQVLPELTVAQKFIADLAYKRGRELHARFMAGLHDRAASRANRIFIDASANQMNAAMRGEKAEAARWSEIATLAHVSMGVHESEARQYRMGFECGRCGGLGVVRHWVSEDDYVMIPCPKCGDFDDAEGLHEDEFNSMMEAYREQQPGDLMN